MESFRSTSRRARSRRGHAGHRKGRGGPSKFTSLLIAVGIVAIGVGAVTYDRLPEIRIPGLRAAPREIVEIPRSEELPDTSAVAAASMAPSAPLTDPSPPVDPALRRIWGELDRLVDAPGWSRATWGVLAVSLDHGDTLYARNAFEPLVPASNAKLLTTSAALHYLGPDFRYRTFVLTDGEIEGGVLYGDLILYGTGDPTLSDRFYPRRTAVYESFADQLRALGIHEVDGRVLGDGTFFSGSMIGAGWNPADLNDWFAAPISALAYNENVVTLRVEPGAAVGWPVVVNTIPEGMRLPIMNTATTVAGRPSSRFGIGRDDPRNPIVLEGELARGSADVWRRITVGDPIGYAADGLRRVLETAGIRVRGGAGPVRFTNDSPLTGARIAAPALDEDAAPRVLATHESVPLVDILTVINKESHNLYAEAVFRTLGRVVVGDGSFEGGARAIERFLSSEVGISTEGFALLDGSGLSRESRVRASDFVALLGYNAESDYWDDFWETLPEAGNRRELQRMYRTDAAGNLRAKTGTLNNVSALSGVVRGAAGERIAFSIISNDVPSEYAAKSRVEDRIGSRLAAFSRPRAGGMQQEEPTETSESSTQLHTVRSGENLTRIAERYGVSMTDILDANPGLSPNRLQAGETLHIPGSGR